MLARPGPKNFKDLRTVDGHTFPTFTEAAVHLNLLASDAIFIRSMQDACADNPSFKRLQHYFAMLLFHSRPSDPQSLFNQFLDEMNPPVAVADPSVQPKSVVTRRAEVMRNLEYFLNCMGSSCR